MITTTGLTPAVGRTQLAREVRYLDTQSGPALIVLHPASDTAEPGTAVLVVPPFGWQADCCYRSLSLWCDHLAAAGHPAARLVLPGTGDSAGSSRDDDLVEGWLDSVRSAAVMVRRWAGATRVAALGIGLGGLLAGQVAGEGELVHDVVMWAVPRSGTRLVREMRAAAGIIAGEFEEEMIATTDDDRSLIVGYRLTEATEASLAAIELTAGRWERPADRHVLLVGREGIAPDRRLCEHLGQQGVEVQEAPGEDLNLLLDNPQQSRPPAATIARVDAWLSSHATRTSAVSAAPAGEPMSETAMMPTPRGPVKETPIRLQAAGRTLFAVLSEPASSPVADVCAVLLGAGAVPHTGPNRAWVDAARRWAADGVAVLRIDLAGIGESPGPDDLLTDASFYDPWRSEEVAAVLDALVARGLPPRFVLGGLCSGAYQALRVALDDPRVVGTLLINLYAVEWSPELVTERGRRHAVATRPGVLVRQPLGPQYIVKAMRYLRPDRAWRLLRRSVERRQHKLTTRALDALAARDVTVLMLLGEGEPLAEQLGRQGILESHERWPNLLLTRIPSRDHMFRRASLQALVHERMDAAVARVRTT